MPNQNQIKWLVSVTMFLSLVPFLVLTVFTNPAFDDWVLTLISLKRGAVEAQRIMYLNWTGKYFSTAVLSVNPLIFGSFAGYRAIGFVIISLTFLATLYFVNALWGANLKGLDKLIATTFIVALFSNQTPDITEAYFWMTGAVIYQLGIILVLLFFAAVILAGRKSGSRRMAFSLAAGVLVVAIVGSNETLMLIFFLLAIPITVVKSINRSRDRWCWMVYILIGLAGSAIVILAPGNAARSSFFLAGRQRFLYSLGMALLQEIRFLTLWISNAPFILGTIIFIPIADKLSGRLELLRGLYLRPLWPTLWLLALVFLGFFPPYWATGMLGQHRTVNTVYFFFLIGWFLNLMVWVVYLREKFKLTFDRLPRYVYIIGVPLMLSSFFFLNNTREAIADLVSLRAYHYHLTVQERRREFEQCARAGKIDECPIQTVDDLPTTITNPYYEKEFRPEKEYWRFKGAASPDKETIPPFF